MSPGFERLSRKEPLLGTSQGNHQRWDGSLPYCELKGLKASNSISWVIRGIIPVR